VTTAHEFVQSYVKGRTGPDRYEDGLETTAALAIMDITGINAKDARLAVLAVKGVLLYQRRFKQT